MAYRSTQYYKDNPRGARMAEGWNRGCVPKKIWYNEPKDEGKLPAIIINWENQEGEVATDFLYENSDRSNARVALLADIANVRWDEGATGRDIAEIFTANLFNVDIEVKWGKGDGAFIQEYAPSNSKPPAKQATPQPTNSAPKTRSKGAW